MDGRRVKKMSEKKILVVDDEEAIRNMLQQAFTEAGYTVRLAESGKEAIEILRQEAIMVTFLDLMMPGMDGIDLHRQIRKDNPIGIVYALTGFNDLFGLLECRNAGFDDFFTKPASIKLLLEAARYAFERIERWKVIDYDLNLLTTSATTRTPVVYHYMGGKVVLVERDVIHDLSLTKEEIREAAMVKREAVLKAIRDRKEDGHV
jgi:DNA-binding response OmpR family regulator